jgi:hypothetical protein
MRAWPIVAFFGLPLACGGNVVVDASTSATGGAGAGGSVATGMGNGGAKPTGVCGLTTCSLTSCLDGIDHGHPPCAGANPAGFDYRAVYLCAGMSCSTACATFLLTCGPLDSTCSGCLQLECPDVLAACTNN